LAGFAPGLGANTIWLELIVRAAKLASYRNLAVLHHVVAVVLREAPQHGLDAVARARALRHDRHALKHAYAALVKQAINQPLARQRRIEQLQVFDGLDSRTAPQPSLVPPGLMRGRAFRRVAGRQIGHARALRRLGQEL